AVYSSFGSRSKPFGHVGAPSSTNTRSKYSLDFSGSAITPPSAMTSDRSRTPSLPSVKRSHNRYPSSGRSRKTSTIGNSFVVIGTGNLLQGQALSCKPPIFFQFGTSRQRPITDKAPCERRQLPADDRAVGKPDYRFRFAITRVQVRRTVIVVEHLNG